ncbi:hypothetical protein LCGC14_0353070, partial [marine sediment metagenome]
IASGLEVVPTFFGLEQVADVADCTPEIVEGSRGGLPQERLSFANAISIDGVDGSCSRRRVAP